MAPSHPSPSNGIVARRAKIPPSPESHGTTTAMMAHNRRHAHCRTYATGALVIVVAFWASYNAQCINQHSSLMNSGLHLQDGRRPSLEPQHAALLLDITSSHRYKRLDSSVLYTNMAEFKGRRAHIEELFRNVGYFHTVPFDSACPHCNKGDGKMISHLQLLERISKEGHDRFILVFEDDVELAQGVPRESFLGLLETEMKHVLQPNDDFAYLGVCLTSEMEVSCTSRACLPWGTHAYMVTPRGARRVMRSIETRYGKYTLDGYIGKVVAFNELIGHMPVLGWNYTHDHVNSGWRGFFYQSRKPPWRWPAMVEGNQTLRVTITHRPKNDALGSFVTPTFLLLAVTQYHGWTLEIMPYTGSEQEKTMIANIAMGDKIDSTWGSGLMDASNRVGYDPMKLNAESYDTLGFFPPVSNSSTANEWLQLSTIPRPGIELWDECRKHDRKHRLRQECFIMMPDDPYIIEAYMKILGGYESVLTKPFLANATAVFLSKNGHRLRHFTGGGYHVAVHLRRGDILVGSFRWVEQFVYAKVARHICAKHADAHIHVFSAGKNPDGNWSAMEGLTSGESKCASVSFHLDEVEFDSWTHMVAADALVMSKSNFGLVPSLLARGEVYYPSEYWHVRMPYFHVFNSVNGDIVS